MNLGIELIIKLSFPRSLRHWLLVTVCLLCVCVWLYPCALVLCVRVCMHLLAVKHGNRTKRWKKTSLWHSKHFIFHIQYCLWILWPWPNHSVNGSLGSSQAVKGSWSLTPPSAAFCCHHSNLATEAEWWRRSSSRLANARKWNQKCPVYVIALN